MIIPTNRLIFWVAAFLPFTVVANAMPGAASLCALPFAGLFIVAVFDAALARSRSGKIEVSVPEIVRLSLERTGSIPVSIADGTMRCRQITVGLPLPGALRSEQRDLEVKLPGQGSHSVVSLQCVPRARGSFPLSKCYFAVRSPLGLWNARGSSVLRSEIRVYPDLLRERKRIAALFMHRGSFGTHRQRVIGQGRDFEKLREYIPGDDYNDIHWKATAKRGRPVTKLYQIERTQEIYAVIDTSRLTARSIGSEPVLEHFITSALVLGLAAEQQHDLFGLVTFGSRVNRFIRASGGKSHFNMCRDALYTVKPQIATPDFDELATFIRLNLRRRALLMVLTDLSDPMLAESFARSIDLFSRQHVTVVCMIRQPGTEPLFSTPNAEDTDQLYRNLGGQMTWQTLRELDRTLARRGARLALVSNDKLSAEIISQYTNIKTRQAL